MSISIAPEIIKEIASELEMGMLVFYQQDTGELVTYPDELKNDYFEKADWKEEINKIKKERNKFLKFEAMDSKQSIVIMTEFADKIDDKSIHEALQEIVANPKPFQHFKQFLHQHSALLEQWYQFKTAASINWVAEQFNNYNLKNK